LNVRNRLKSLRLDQQGTTAVEFAIIAPVFIALTVGTLALCFRQNDDMLGFGDNHCLCAKPLFRPERVTHLYIRCRGLWQFRERVDQLFDGSGLENLHNSDFGHGLLSLMGAGGCTASTNSLK
jgi:hypothetical protein